MWELFHAYRKLAAEGKVKPLTCPDDECPLVTVLNPDSTRNTDVFLWCSECGAMTSPGLSVIEQIKAVVAEHSES